MAERKISRDYFIATIGYDAATAVVNKEELKSLKGKSFAEILASNNFRLAAACAVYDENEQEKQAVVDAYNKATGGHYTTAKLSRLFGISQPAARKVLSL